MDGVSGFDICANMAIIGVHIGTDVFLRLPKLVSRFHTRMSLDLIVTQGTNLEGIEV